MATSQSSFGESIEEYEVLNLLGKGGFASVYRAKCSKSGLEVAIKMIDKKLMKAAGMVERVRQEVAIHSRLKHPAVLELYTFFEDTNYVYLVLELCHNGELQRFLKSNNKILCEEDACHVFRQVVEGLIYLHSHNILHRDLTLANLLLSKDMQVKIADFGLATQLSRPDEKHLTMCGTPNYISPEVATRSSHGLEADVWGLGCMLYTLLIGRPPFDTDAVKSTLTRVVMADYQLPSHLSPEARDLIDLLLKKNPKERIKLRAILDHPFMKKNQKQYEYLQKKWMTRESDSGMGTMSTDPCAGLDSLTTNGSNKERIISMYSQQSDDEFQSKLFSRADGKATHSVLSQEKYTFPSRTEDPCNSSTSYLRCKFGNEEIKNLESRSTLYNSILKNDRDHSLERNKSCVANCCGNNRSLYSQATLSKCQCCSQSIHELGHAGDPSAKVSSFHSCKQVSDESLKEANVCRSDAANVVKRQAMNCTRSCYSDGLLSCRMANVHLCERLGHSHCEAVESQWKSGHAHYSCHNADVCATDRSKRELPSEERCHHKWPDPTGKQPDNFRTVKSSNGPMNDYQDDNNVFPEKKSSIMMEQKTKPPEKAERRVLNGLTPALNTYRLQPTRHRTKNAVLSILDSGEVCIEFVKKRGGEERVIDVCRISTDGMRVVLYQPNSSKGCPLENFPPELPKQGTDAIYSYESLPQKHWKKYLYATRFIDLVKAKTPKVTYYCEKAKCLLMENSPDPDFEACFYEGGKIVKSKNEVKLIDAAGKSTVMQMDSKDKSLNVSIMWNQFEQYYNHCIALEKSLTELADKAGVSCFPIIVGRRPPSSVKAVLQDKENMPNNQINISPQNAMLHSFETSSATSMHVNASYGNSAISSSRFNIKSTNSEIKKTEPLKQVLVPSIGVASQYPSGDLKVEYLDGSQIIINSHKATTEYVSTDGKTVFYQQKDLLPFHIREKLSLMPKVLEHLMNGQERRPQTRGLR
ncbi:hypothetical protein J437_LFUL015517 [Ladona fulva]|uniref:Serine/threonine-protein kinase PLK4 n=1 Tax=Ladona fulva TaxID=123851 RepID=A0A8K0P8V3_LADFU|nr:hypothetical protein J437_LFUL015517 [Ladona fulva]